MISDKFYLQVLNTSTNQYVETNLNTLAKALSKNSYFKGVPTLRISTGYSYVETGNITGLQISGYGLDGAGNINFTGYEFFSEPFSYKIENLNTFSGYNYKSDISTEGVFVQNQVNLGLNNRNFSGSQANIVGLYNSASSAPQNKSYILGGSNNLNKSDNSNIFGFNNKIDSANFSISIGDSNQTIRGEYNNLNLGFSNLISGLNNPKSQDTYNIGWGNKSVNTTGVKVFGEANLITSVQDAVVIGENIFLEKSNQINAIGKNLSIGEAFYDTVIGTNNILDYTYKNTLLGIDSEIFDSSRVYLVGENNLSTGDERNYIFGRDNESVLNKESHIIGDDNLISNSTNLNFFGNFSEINGLTDSTTIGEVNNLNNSFGITVIGKSNNVTGLLNGIIVGEYNTQGHLNTGNNVLPATGLAGKNLYVFGRSNNGKNNENLFTFGESNIGLDSYKSYIIGNENVASKAVNSYIFGENNSVSGFKNYIFGSNNIVRSGDRNSILIGISHEFTGARKTSSVHIASANSSIEITSSEINLVSPSRPKYNNVEITMPQDLLGLRNGIIPSGSFESTTFQDLEYNSLATRIELPRFKYLNLSEKYYVSGIHSGISLYDDGIFDIPFVPQSSQYFYGVNPDGSENVFDFTNYFVKKSSQSYKGTDPILGDYFYESDDGEINLLHSLNDFDSKAGSFPKWIIRKKNTIGCYYLNKNNLGINQSFPLTGWYSTGFAGFSGKNPAPVFKEITGQFEEVFEKKILDLGDFNTSNIFISEVAYPAENISVIYGKHSNPQFESKWLVVDNLSSGVYYTNNNYSSDVTPQTGWSPTNLAITGFGFYSSGVSVSGLSSSGGNGSLKLSMGSRVGVIGTKLPGTDDKVYIPYFY
jgi:hypothetical protein